MKYIAAKTFRAEIDGEDTLIREGIDRVDQHHELYRRFPENWKPIDESDVEQATAAPGERRDYPSVKWDVVNDFSYQAIVNRVEIA